jgi:RNA polymerase sigma-70 factor, ECF subfamily
VIEQPDPDVLCKARRGDETAFTLIARQYETRLFDFILCSVEERVVADHLMQDVLLRACRALPRFNGHSFTSWLFQIAAHRVLDEPRARHRPQQRLVSLDAASGAAVDTSVGDGEPLRPSCGRVDRP